MGDKLKYNVDDLRNQANKVEKIREELQESKDALLAQIEGLKTEWVSSTSALFFDKIDTGWTSEIDRYCSLLGDVAEALQYAADEYAPLEEQYKRLSLG